MMNIFQNSATRFVFVLMVVTLCILTVVLALIGDASKFSSVFEVFKLTIGGVVLYFTAKSTQDSANKINSKKEETVVQSNSTPTIVQTPEHHDLSEFNV
jgi:hypothetical protein